MMQNRHVHYFLFAIVLIAVALSSAALKISMETLQHGNAPVMTVPVLKTEPGVMSGDSIRSYLMQNPNVIYEALQQFQKKQQQQQDQGAVGYVKEHGDEFYKAAMSPVLGNPKGDLTIVEFFDFNCGYCKQSHPVIDQLLADNKNIRLVHKNLPILGPTSLTAAKAALASQKQGKYEKFSNALLEFKGHLNDQDVMTLAKGSGLKLDQLQKDMDDPAIMQEIEANVKLAQSINVSGTPAFIVGDRIIRGSASAAEWKQTLAEVNAPKAAEQPTATAPTETKTDAEKPAIPQNDQNPPFAKAVPDDKPAKTE